jgi:hypothetical protein
VYDVTADLLQDDAVHTFAGHIRADDRTDKYPWLALFRPKGDRCGRYPRFPGIGLPDGFFNSINYLAKS